MPKTKGKDVAGSSQPQAKRPRHASEGANPRKKKNIHTPRNRVARMALMRFEATRWVDHDFLQQLGIYGDVKKMFEEMGLMGLFRMKHSSHKSETKQFMASLEFEDDTSLDLGDEDRGIMTFIVNNKVCKVSANQVSRIFDAPIDGEVYTLELDPNEAQGVWTTIAQGTFDKGFSKAALIRHPAIRYAHKFLANVLFPRRETGNVKEDELAWLIEGITTSLRETETGKEIIGQTKRLHLGHYIIRRLLSYQDWIVTHKDSTPVLNIGGLITPILIGAGVSLTEAEEPKLMDAAFLAHSKMLAGRLMGRFCYRFIEGTEKKLILLPNVEETSFEERENILFHPSPEHLYNRARDGPLARVRTSRRTKTSQPQDGDESSEDEEPVIGSRRYDFDPYAVPVASEPLRKAHEHIGLLRRGFKWQGRQIKKMVKKIKKQGAIIKRLLKGQSSPRPTANQEEEDRQLAMVLAEEEERGRGCGSSRGKGKAPISPSSSGSGNPTYDMEEESSSESPTI